jgi:hypothetical protein
MLFKDPSQMPSEERRCTSYHIVDIPHGRKGMTLLRSDAYDDEELGKEHYTVINQNGSMHTSFWTKAGGCETDAE